MVWLIVRVTKLGASAPSAASIGAARAVPTMIRRRPIRSANRANGATRTIPKRTTVPALPWAPLPIPNSSAAKLTVWVNTVLTNAADSDAAASRPRTST